MIERIRKKYAMTEKGAKDYVAAVFWSVLVNISKMLPVGVLATALSGIVEALTNGTGRVPTAASGWRRCCASFRCPSSETGT